MIMIKAMWRFNYSFQCVLVLPVGGIGRVVNGAFMVLKGHRSIVNQVRFNPHTYMICSSGVEKIIKVRLIIRKCILSVFQEEVLRFAQHHSFPHSSCLLILFFCKEVCLICWLNWYKFWIDHFNLKFHFSF